MAEQDKRRKKQGGAPAPVSGPHRGEEEKQQPRRLPPKTESSQEWGERLATGRAIARGGKTTGHVPGATERPVGPQERTPDPDEEAKE